MSYKQYKQHKDSSVEWIGEIPQHWEIKKVSAIFEQRSEKVSDKDFEPLSVTKMGILKQLENVAKTDNNDNRKKVLKNDFVINSRSDRKGSCGVSQFDGSVSLICTVIKPKTKNTYMDYYHHLFRNKMFSEEFYRWGRGIVDDLWSTRWDEFKRILIPSPPYEEQKSIANYLNYIYETIENLINNKKQQMATLQQYRQSLITETVTCGLNPYAKMKDSGLEWIGQIPSHWEIKKNKMITNSITVGIVITPSKYYIEGEGGIPCLRSLNVKEGEIINTDLVYISNESNELLSKSKIYEGDLVSIRTGDTGVTSVVPKEYDGANCIDLIIIRKSTKINSAFLCYLLNSNVAKQQYRNLSGGAIQQHFNIEMAKNTYITYPPFEEQLEIVNYLDLKTTEIDSVIKKIKEQIILLEKYRQSLIYEAVTGKIDVRSYTESEQEVRL
ncbi:TPA: restriction endonuclease subunit S [Bacillus nitratireducens]|uniref:restriction endonuclease subunit S n=1 Tax=Bacillus cereus group TaxID=86661 RepID=UPI00019FBF68|nr:restriction endonuclease subunit S [Bacillus cereus]EEK43029.1 hypothetical protein bcere0001_41580 [Bacillus cereus m1293]HDR7515554.1 restriction endonuclease subunit S [Bacillus mobilis]HDR7792213.1 restriction endonuclease subunit S [Bacillus luti]MDQ4482248.1 restriction endonuclease subunit S [Bacillus cereus]ONG65649.1 restriction endonuclease subunit S [Bacillus cereus]